MSIIKKSDGQVFDLEQIGRGDFIHTRYIRSGETRNGLVFRAEAGKLTVQFMADIPNVSVLFHLFPQEVAAGEWAIDWSHDLAQVYHEGGDAP